MRDFNTMAEQLQSMTREREFWNAAIAHELRTPVAILRGRLQGLAEGVFPPERALFEGLLRQVEGLTHLIEDLRVLSLNDSGHLELQREAIRLADELAVVLEAFATPWPRAVSLSSGSSMPNSGSVAMHFASVRP